MGPGEISAGAVLLRPLAAARRRRRLSPLAPPSTFTTSCPQPLAATCAEPKAVAGRRRRRARRDETGISEGSGSYDVSGRTMSQDAGSYQCAAHARRRDGRRGTRKEGVSAAACTVNQRCVFNASDLDVP